MTYKLHVLTIFTRPNLQRVFPAELTAWRNINHYLVKKKNTKLAFKNDLNYFWESTYEYTRNLFYLWSWEKKWYLLMAILNFMYIYMFVLWEGDGASSYFWSSNTGVYSCGLLTFFAGSEKILTLLSKHSIAFNSHSLAF